MRVTALAGGTGAAKLLRGLASARPRHELTIIGNTGDDTEIWGLHVPPDLDTVTYAPAGRLDATRGGGGAADPLRRHRALADLAAETWLNRPRRALATHPDRRPALAPRA